MLIDYVAFALPGGAVALGVLFLAKAVSLVRKVVACTHWPTVTGKIINAQTETQIEDDSTEVDRPRRRRRREQVYVGAAIRYAFSVAGRDYQSTRRYVGRPVLSGNPGAAAAVLAKYPPDAPVLVHYNPSNPAEAMLEPSNLANVYLALGVGVGFGVCGLIGLSVLWAVL